MFISLNFFIILFGGCHTILPFLWLFHRLLLGLKKRKGEIHLSATCHNEHSTHYHFQSLCRQFNMRLTVLAWMVIIEWLVDIFDMLFPPCLLSPSISPFPISSNNSLSFSLSPHLPSLPLSPSPLHSLAFYVLCMTVCMFALIRLGLICLLYLAFLAFLCVYPWHATYCKFAHSQSQYGQIWSK